MDYPARYCPAASAIDVIGDRWLLLLLREALYGMRRFETFQSDLGISRSVLADRLKQAVELDLFERVPYAKDGRRTRYEYRLTEKGSALATVFVALADWGAAYHPPETDTHIRITDAKSGERVQAALLTTTGDLVPTRRLLRAELVPAGPAA